MLMQSIVRARHCQGQQTADDSNTWSCALFCSQQLPEMLSWMLLIPGEKAENVPCRNLHQKGLSYNHPSFEPFVWAPWTLHKQTLWARHMLIKSTKQLFMDILFISSTPSRAGMKEPLVVSAVTSSPWDLWTPGKGLSGGKGLAFAAPWSWFSVCIFYFSCSCFASLIFKTPVSTIPFYLSNLLWLCSTDFFTALLCHTISSSA